VCILYEAHLLVLEFSKMLCHYIVYYV
jgi:hypothetical protein